MSLERTKAGVCALFLLAGCSPLSAGNRLSDRDWDAIMSEGVRQSYAESGKSCDKVKVVGSPGYYSCPDDYKVEPYVGHLFD